LDGFYNTLAARCGLSRALQADWAEGVNAQVRTDGVRDYIFLHNFTAQEQCILFKESVNDLDGTPIEPYLRLPAYGYRVLMR
jgi:beta-galactosidase